MAADDPSPSDNININLLPRYLALLWGSCSPSLVLTPSGSRFRTVSSLWSQVVRKVCIFLKINNFVSLKFGVTDTCRCSGVSRDRNLLSKSWDTKPCHRSDVSINRKLSSLGGKSKQKTFIILNSQNTDNFYHYKILKDRKLYSFNYKENCQSIIHSSFMGRRQLSPPPLQRPSPQHRQPTQRFVN